LTWPFGKNTSTQKGLVGRDPERISSLRVCDLKRLSQTSAVTVGVRRAPGPTGLWPGTAGRAPNGRLNSKWGDLIRQANIRELFDAGSVGSSDGVRYR
jgi:hypothetical protein